MKRKTSRLFKLNTRHKQAPTHQVCRARQTTGKGSSEVPCFGLSRVDDQVRMPVCRGGCLLVALTVKFFRQVNRSSGLRAQVAQLSAGDVVGCTVHKLDLAREKLDPGALLRQSCVSELIGRHRFELISHSMFDPFETFGGEKDTVTLARLVRVGGFHVPPSLWRIESVAALFSLVRVFASCVLNTSVPGP